MKSDGGLTREALALTMEGKDDSREIVKILQNLKVLDMEGEENPE